VAGIDLSRVIDLSAVSVVIERDGVLYIFAQFFLPKEKIAEATARDGLPYDIYIKRGLLVPSGENFIDYKDVYQYMVDLVEKYQIYPLKVGFDRYNATYLTDSLRTYGFHMDDVYQGTNLSPIINTLEGLMKDGKVRIGDNDLLKMHLLNSALKTETETNRRRLVKVNPGLHIDGVAATLDALTMRDKYAGEIGEQLKN
jgi:phage terminase large subunit-like protein